MPSLAAFEQADAAFVKWMDYTCGSALAAHQIFTGVE
jgi:hypothetical protein